MKICEEIKRELGETISNSDAAYDIADEVLKDLKVKNEKELDLRFDEIAKEIIFRAKKQKIKLNKYDVAEILDGD